MSAHLSLIRWLGAFCLLLSISSQLYAQQPTTTLTFDFADFTELEVSSVFNVTATRGDEFSVTVTIDSDDADRVSVTQTGSRLNISLLFGDGNIQTIEAAVTMPLVNRVDLSGVVTLTLSGFNQSQLVAEIDGVSTLRGDSVTIANLVATLSGVSRIDFVNVTPISSANLDVSGVSDVTLNMATGGTLSGSVTGTSRLFYYGTDVTLNVDVATGAQLTRLGDTLMDGFRINPGLSGAWFDANAPGQGFVIEVLPNSATIFLAWFTYDTMQPGSQSAEVGHDGHRWLTAQGAFAGSTAELDIALTSGGLFVDADTAVDQSAPDSYGTITLSFNSCSSGQVDYALTGAGLSGTVVITRIANDNVPLCQQLGGGATAKRR